LGGGIPLGATITSSRIAEKAVENGFLHFTTHVSDPMPAAAVLDVIADEDLVQRTRKMGAYLMDQLRALRTEFPQIGDVRGRGLLVGLELVEDPKTKQPANDLGGAVTEECLRLGLSMNIVKGDGSQRNCLRLAPPLTITAGEIDIAIDILATALRTCG
jgi:2,2-dialkylglycine decarboxylase (pyruvate)